MLYVCYYDLCKVKVEGKMFVTTLLITVYFDRHIDLVDPFQPSDAMWRRTFHLSLVCMSFAH
jgi:hypothetical protein